MSRSERTTPGAILNDRKPGAAIFQRLENILPLNGERAIRFTISVGHVPCFRSGMMRKTDDQIRKEVLDELEWDSRLASSEIGAHVKDGVVTLIGTTASYAASSRQRRVSMASPACSTWRTTSR